MDASLSPYRPRLAGAMLLSAALGACGTAGDRRHDGPAGRERDSAGERPPASQTLSGVTRLDANDRFRIHLADVQIALTLTPGQIPLWQAYERGVFALISADRRERAARGAAPGEIDRRVQEARSRESELERLSAEAKKLYATLSEEQKRVADRLLPGTIPSVSFGPAE